MDRKEKHDFCLQLCAVANEELKYCSPKFAILSCMHITHKETVLVQQAPEGLTFL